MAHMLIKSKLVVVMIRLSTHQILNRSATTNLITTYSPTLPFIIGIESLKLSYANNEQLDMGTSMKAFHTLSFRSDTPDDSNRSGRGY